MTSVNGRRALALGILALWVLMVGLHVRREYFKPVAMRLTEGSRTLLPGALFYIVRMNERAIGMATSRLDTLPDAFVFDDMLSLDVPALDTVHRAVARTRVELSRALELRSFNFDLTSEIGRFSVQGRVRENSVIDLQVGTGADVQRTSMRLEPGALLPTALPLRLAAGNELAVGREYQVRLFDPSVLSSREVSVRVTERSTMIVPDSVRWDADRKEWVITVLDTLPVYRVEETFGGIKVASWVDANGRIVRAESPLGFTVERTTYELAWSEWQEQRASGELAAGYGVVIEGTAIASNVDLGAGGDTKALRVRLLGVELEGFDLAGGRQTLHGDTLLIARERPEHLIATYRLPYTGGGAVAAELEATPLIQALDPRMVRRAQRIADGETDPAVVAQKLNTWVYHALEKKITLSVPSALQVLEGRQGDCNEHTVLYVALARALVLPARTAVGLVYVRGRFYYHAWPEVWLDRWVAIDPTFGQFPADAAHLRVLVGGLSRQVELIRLIGRLGLEVET